MATAITKKAVTLRAGIRPQDVADELRNLATVLDGMCGTFTGVAITSNEAKTLLAVKIETPAPEPDCGKKGRT